MKKNYLFIGLFFIFISLSIIRFSLNTSIKQYTNEISFRESEGLYDDYSWAYFMDNNSIENANSVEAHLTTQNDVENYLKSTGNDLSGDKIWLDNNENIRFPTGTYKITSQTEFYLPSASGDIDFHGSSFAIGGNGIIYSTVIGDQHHRSYKNLTIYGNSKIEIANTDNYNLVRSGNGFYLQAIKASNMIFSNLEFNNSHMPGYHLFDIMGCNNFSFNDITNRGALEDWNNDQLSNIYNKNPHMLFSEMIQIDVTGKNSAGLKKFLSDDFENNYFSNDLLGDDIPTTNTTFTKIRSTSYKGVTGQGIIDGSNAETSKPLASTIGAHGVGNTPYTGININNAYFENAVHISGQKDKRLAPIHFSVVSNNTISQINSNSPTGDDLVQLITNDNVWKNIDISLDNNTYINCSNEIDDSEHPNEKVNHSTYLAGFDKNMKSINSIKIVLDDGTLLNTYNRYVPEEKIYNNSYIYDSSSYNNGVLTRVYKKPLNKIINHITYLDENGNIIDNTDGYTLINTDIKKRITEKLVDGNTITIQYSTNTYQKGPLILENVPDTGKFRSILDILIGLTFIAMGGVIIKLNKKKTN